VLWVEQPHCTCDVEAPVATLGHVLRVSEVEHQLVAYFGVLRECETGLGDALAKAEVGEGGRNDVESRVSVRPFKEREQFGNLNEGARPYMH